IKKNDFYEFKFDLPEKLERFVVEKGSVALDGISLTISDITRGSFSVWVIPETYRKTNLQYRKRSEWVNVESDIMAKYVEKQVSKYKNTSEISEKLLRNGGFL
ncbi:unnamed protein product, partial [marine sediment metagenome]